MFNIYGGRQICRGVFVVSQFIACPAHNNDGERDLSWTYRFRYYHLFRCVQCHHPLFHQFFVNHITYKEFGSYILTINKFQCLCFWIVYYKIKCTNLFQYTTSFVRCNDISPLVQIITRCIGEICKGANILLIGFGNHSWQMIFPHCK